MSIRLPSWQPIRIVGNAVRENWKSQNSRNGTQTVILVQGHVAKGRVREGKGEKGGVCLNVQQDLIFIASIFEFYCVRNARYNRSGHKKRLEPCPRRLPNGRTAQMSHTAAREEGEGGSDDFWESRVDKAAATWTFLGHVGVIFHAIK